MGLAFARPHRARSRCRVFVLRRRRWASPFFCRDGHRASDLGVEESLARSCCQRWRGICERSGRCAFWSARSRCRSRRRHSRPSRASNRRRTAPSFAGLMKRQPISMVSKMAFSRANAELAFGITKGARLMLSTPPATSSPASPARMAWAALPTAFMPDPHRRFSVTPGTSIGSPASSALMRATFRLSSPAWFAHPSEHVVDRSRIQLAMARQQRADRNRCPDHPREPAEVRRHSGRRECAMRRR